MALAAKWRMSGLRDAPQYLLDSGDAKELWIDSKYADLARWTGIAVKMECMDDLGRCARWATCHRISRIHGKLLPAVQAQARRVHPNAKFSLRLRVIGVMFFSASVDVVRVSLIPRLNRVPAVVAYKSNALGHRFLFPSSAHECLKSC
jgi:hypothetical protein